MTDTIAKIHRALGNITTRPAGDGYLGKGDGSGTIVVDVSKRTLWVQANKGEPPTPVPLVEEISILPYIGIHTELDGVRVSLGYPPRSDVLHITGHDRSEGLASVGGITPSEQLMSKAQYPDVGSMINFRLSPNNPVDSEIYINPGMYKDADGNPAFWGGDSTDDLLTDAIAALSSGEHIMAVVYIDTASGEPGIITNTAEAGGVNDKQVFDTTTIMEMAHSPGEVLTGAVHLYYGQTTITEGDIYRSSDPRMMFAATGTSAGSGTVTSVTVDSPDGTLLITNPTVTTAGTISADVADDSLTIGKFDPNLFHVDTTNPTVSNDTTQGYIVRSRWLNSTAGREFVCTNNSTGAAAWKETTMSITLTVPSEITVTGSPLTAAGTLALSWTAQSGRKFLASPSGGGSGVLTARAIINDDIAAALLVPPPIGGTTPNVVTGSLFKLPASTTLTLASDAITVTQGFHLVGPQTGTADDLVTINGGSGVMSVILQASSGNTITVKNGTGNVFLSGGADYALSGNKRIELFYNGTNWGDLTVALASGFYQTVQNNGVDQTQRGKINLKPGPGITLTFNDDSVNNRTDVTVNATAASLTVAESDGSPSVTDVITIKFSNGTVTNDGGGVVTVDNSGGGSATTTRSLDIPNNSFEIWENGTAAAPDNWTVTGSGATIAREGTIVKHGSYSAKLTRVGNDCTFVNDLYTRLGGIYIRSRTLTYGAFVYASAASTVRLRVDDGVTVSLSSYHTGGGAWEWLSITFTVGASITQLKLGLDVSGSNTSGYIDAMALVEGSVMSSGYYTGTFNKILDNAIIDQKVSKVVTGNAFSFDTGTAQMYGRVFQFPAAINDAWENVFFIMPGSYTLIMLGEKTNDRGIASVYIDDVLQGTVDWYNSTAQINQRLTLSVTVLGEPGRHVLKMAMLAKNASSSNYYLNVPMMYLQPTAAY